MCIMMHRAMEDSKFVEDKFFSSSDWPQQHDDSNFITKIDIDRTIEYWRQCISLKITATFLRMQEVHRPPDLTTTK